MPITPPVANRTFWFNASDNDKLWTGSPAGTGANPTDGQSVQSWNDEDAGSEEFQETTNPPIWRSNGINMLGAVDFDGTNDIFTSTGASLLSDVVSASAFTVFVSFYLEGAAENQASVWNNVGLISDLGDFWGLHLKTVAGVHSVHAYNWDGAAASTSKTISLNTPYVAMMRHEGGNLYLSVNQGIESSVASGVTSTLTNAVRPATPSSGSVFYNGRIGEILCYNVALTGNDFFNAYQYMADKWGAAFRALTQARSGIARSGATRSNFFVPNIVALINGTDRSGSIEEGSVSISLALNDEPDTASFRIKPLAGFTPVANQEIVLALGASNNREFAGQISQVTHVRGHHHAWAGLQVSCVDYGRLFDRRLVTKEYSSTTATAIAKDLIDTYTSGFTRNNIAPDLPTIDYFPLTNESLSGAFRRLALLVGGGFYIDATKDVHLFGSSGEPAGRAPTPPRAITNYENVITAFTHDHDGSQVRTRVTVEGQRTNVPNIAVPAGSTTFPVDDDLIFNPADTPTSGGGFTYTRLGRIGTQRFTYTFISELNLIPGVSYPATNTAAAAAAGATSIEIDALPPDETGWAKVGEQVIFFLDTDTAPNRLIQIPPSGFGSITAAIEANTQVTWLPFIGGIPASGAGSIQSTQPAGVDVVSILQVDETAAQTTLAAVEGGDGIHDHVISDHRLSVAGAQTRALAELGAFSESLEHAEWVTYDMNAKPGRPQQIALTVTDPVSTTLTITRTELTFPMNHSRPRRHCESSTVKVAEREDLFVSTGEF